MKVRCAGKVRGAEAGDRSAQYGGFHAERDVGPPRHDPACAAVTVEAEERRQRAMVVPLDVLPAFELPAFAGRGPGKGAGS